MVQPPEWMFKTERERAIEHYTKILVAQRLKRLTRDELLSALTRLIADDDRVEDLLSSLIKEDTEILDAPDLCEAMETVYKILRGVIRQHLRDSCRQQAEEVISRQADLFDGSL